MLPEHLRDLEARGLRLVPVGGRPPKTVRDVAVYLALQWYEAGAAPGRPKLREAVCDLWIDRGYRGLTDPAHVTARVGAARRALPADASVIITKGEGTTPRGVAPGAGVLLVPAASMTTDQSGSMQFHGPVWSWAHGDENAQYFDASGIVTYRSPTSG
jgi:hypothetical protein